MEMQTTADYDPRTQEFIIHTPGSLAQKWVAVGLGAGVRGLLGGGRGRGRRPGPPRITGADVDWVEVAPGVGVGSVRRGGGGRSGCEGHIHTPGLLSQKRLEIGMGLGCAVAGKGGGAGGQVHMPRSLAHKRVRIAASGWRGRGYGCGVGYQ